MKTLKLMALMLLYGFPHFNRYYIPNCYALMRSKYDELTRDIDKENFVTMLSTC